VLNTGFTQAALTPAAVEDAEVGPAPAASTGLVAYARMMNLEAGDTVDLRITGPSGQAVAAGHSPPLDHDKALWVVQAGLTHAPAGGWPHGAYDARLEVRRAGALTLSAQWRTQI
jgi:hypothetical protein